MFYVLAAVAFWIFAPGLVRQFFAWQRSSAAERSFVVRFTAFTWLLGMVFVLGILFLPNKGRILLLLPIFIAGTSLVKWWQTSRSRLRRQAEEESNFTRARRIN